MQMVFGFDSHGCAIPSIGFAVDTVTSATNGSLADASPTATAKNMKIQSKHLNFISSPKSFRAIANFNDRLQSAVCTQIPTFDTVSYPAHCRHTQLANNKLKKLK
jgi:hypothetical protein